MRNLVLALGFVALMQSSGWAQDSSRLFGVWTGTIGKLPVMVCLDTRRDYHFGAYYYLAHLKAIHLEENDDGKSWTEGSSSDTNAPRWQLDPVDGNKIKGTWATQEKSFPINLTRLAENPKDADGQESACGSQAFFQPRVTPPKITETAAVLDGQSYVKVTVNAGEQFNVSLETFKLKGSGAKIARINKTLLQGVPQPGQKPDYLECIQSGLANGGNDGDYDTSAVPIILTPHWLVAASGDGSFCGGAHPVNSSAKIVYDLRTGIEVDLKKWLRPGVADENGKLSGKLAMLVEEKYKADAKDNPDCIDSIQNAFGWGLSLEKTGISFTPSLSHAETACANASLLGFSSVLPFLNDNGKKLLADFRSELTN